MIVLTFLAQSKKELNILKRSTGWREKFVRNVQKKSETLWGYKKHMAIHKCMHGKYNHENCGKTFTHSSYLK